MPFRKERIAKLVEALRSGEFSQTRGRLRDPEGYCCLGVACEVFKRETGNGEWKPDHIGSRLNAFHCRDYEGLECASVTDLPAPVRDWFGFPSWSGCEMETDTGKTASMIHLNDILQWDFNQIAEGLEKWRGE